MTGVLPSCSQATPAAIEPRIEAITGDRVVDQAKRRIRQQRVAGADRDRRPLPAKLSMVKNERTLRVGRAVGDDPAVAHLEDQRLAAGPLVQLQRQRPDRRVLVAQREAGLPLVRRDQVEALEVEDVAPAAGHLAVGDAEARWGACWRQLGDRLPAEDAVAEVAEDDRVGRRRDRALLQLVRRSCRRSAGCRACRP